MHFFESLTGYLYLIMGILYAISFFVVLLIYKILGKPKVGRLGTVGTFISMWIVSPFILLYMIYRRCK